MSARSRLWFAAFVLVVFIMGAFSGVVLDRLWLMARSRAAFVQDAGVGLGPGPGRRGGGPGRVAIEGQVTRLARQLELTDAQRGQLREILRRWNVRATELQGEARLEFIEAQAALRADIESILSADQLTQFRSLRGDAGLGRRGGPPREGGRGR
jgi:uncharacterized membrane protein